MCVCVCVCVCVYVRVIVSVCKKQSPAPSKKRKEKKKKERQSMGGNGITTFQSHNNPLSYRTTVCKFARPDLSTRQCDAELNLGLGSLQVDLDSFIIY